MQTIEPKAQETILDVLPDDGNLAIEVMCQLLANMILSVPSNLPKVTERIKFYIDDYAGT